jgi:hypothetical protein
MTLSVRSPLPPITTPALWLKLISQLRIDAVALHPRLTPLSAPSLCRC